MEILDDAQHFGTPKQAIPGFNYKDIGTAYFKTNFPLNLFLQHLFVHKPT
jgi:hypothetical protein